MTTKSIITLTPKAITKTDSQLVYGKEILWAKVLEAYGKITAGLSKIKLEQRLK